MRADCLGKHCHKFLESDFGPRVHDLTRQAGRDGIYSQAQLHLVGEVLKVQAKLHECLALLDATYITAAEQFLLKYRFIKRN